MTYSAACSTGCLSSAPSDVVSACICLHFVQFRRADDVHPSNHDFYADFLHFILLWTPRNPYSMGPENNPNYAKIRITRRKIHWFRSIWPENSFGPRDHSDYADFTVIQLFLWIHFTAIYHPITPIRFPAPMVYPGTVRAELLRGREIHHSQGYDRKQRYGLSVQNCGGKVRIAILCWM